MMEMQSVTSSNVAAVGYDAESETLHVQFHNGTLYAYTGVPQQTADELVTASSVGRYFNNVIKPAFSAKRIS